MQRRAIWYSSRWTSRYQKRGGDATKVTFDEGLLVSDEPRQDFAALDDALEALAKFDARRPRSLSATRRQSDDHRNAGHEGAD